jgi:hypothetical protein
MLQYNIILWNVGASLAVPQTSKYKSRKTKEELVGLGLGARTDLWDAGNSVFCC